MSGGKVKSTKAAPPEKLTVPKGYKRVSPGVYRDTKGKLVKYNPAKVISSRDKKKEPPLRKVELSVRQGDAPRQIIYGTFKTGGIITFAHMSPSFELPTDPPDTYRVDQLHLIVTIATHKIEAVQRCFLDGEEVRFQGSYYNNPPSLTDEWAILTPGESEHQHALANRFYINVQKGDENQAAVPALLQPMLAFPGVWTTDHRQRGCAYCYHRLKFNEKAFPGGLPNIVYLIKGKADIWDPRDNGYRWTDNAALIVADYLLNPIYGLGCTQNEIDIDALIDAANYCDTDLGGIGTGFKRYRINGRFEATASHEQTLQEMADAMGGDIVWQGDKWRILPGKYRAWSLDLNEDDFRGPIHVRTHATRDDMFNIAKVTYIDPNTFEAGEIVISQNQFIVQAGEKLVKSFNYSAVTSSIHAHLLATLELERIQQGILVSATFSPKLLKVQVGDVVRLSFAKYGWNLKEFEVRAMTIVHDRNAGVSIEAQLAETSAAMYEWVVGQDLIGDRAPNTTLPNPYDVSSPTDFNVTSSTADLFVARDGTVISRAHLSWAIDEGLGDAGGELEIEYKLSADASFTPVATVPAYTGNFYVFDVVDGRTYDFRIRAKNALGARSQWVARYSIYIVGKSAPPGDVQGLRLLADDFGIVLYWSALPDIDLSHYIVRLGDSWETSTFLSEARATSYRYSGAILGTMTFWVIGVDTSGNQSAHAAVVSATFRGPDPVDIDWTINGTDVVLTWNRPISTFALDSFHIRHGAQGYTYYEFATTTETETKSLFYRTKANWLGTVRFGIIGVDVRGVPGAAAYIDITINGPSALTSLSAQVIDNNVLLRWIPSTAGTLPIGGYKVYKGPSYPDNASPIGDAQGTFSAIFEMVSGVFRYWVVPYDAAGNLGPASSVLATVSEPPDFVLKASGILDPLKAVYMENVFVEGAGFVANQWVPTPPLPVPEPSPAPGQPVGLLLAITNSVYVPPTPPVVPPAAVYGQPIGLLLALTVSSGSNGGQPTGLLLGITTP